MLYNGSLFTAGNLDVDGALPHLEEGSVVVQDETEIEIARMEGNEIEKVIEENMSGIESLMQADSILNETKDSAVGSMDNASNLPADEVVTKAIEVEAGLNSAIGILNYNNLKTVYDHLGVYSEGLNSSVYSNPITSLEDGLNGVKTLANTIWLKIKSWFVKISSFIKKYVMKFMLWWRDFEKKADKLKEEAGKIADNAEFKAEGLSPLSKIILVEGKDVMLNEALKEIEEKQKQAAKEGEEAIKKAQNLTERMLIDEQMRLFKTFDKIPYMVMNVKGFNKYVEGERDCLIPISTTEIYTSKEKNSIKELQEVTEMAKKVEVNVTDMIVPSDEILKVGHKWLSGMSQLLEPVKNSLNVNSISLSGYNGKKVKDRVNELAADIKSVNSVLKKYLDSCSEQMSTGAKYSAIRWKEESEAVEETIKQTIKYEYLKGKFCYKILSAVCKAPVYYLKAGHELVKSVSGGSSSSSDSKSEEK